MAEYYSKEKLLENARTTWCDMYDFEDFLREIPTADVVPRAEVREIFEDIDTILLGHLMGNYDIEDTMDAIRKLKKKYTEGVKSN